jgi:dynactin 1
MGGYDVDQALFQPLQKVVDQCRAAKNLSRKLIKRVEDLAVDSAAVKAHLIPQMKALADNVDEVLNFGISVSSSPVPPLCLS